MKNTNKVFLAVAVATLSFMGLGQTKADDSLLPPRAQALTPKLVGRDSNEPDLVRSQAMGPAAKIAALKTTVRAKAETAASPKGGPLFTGNNPFRTTQPTFEVAPLK